MFNLLKYLRIYYDCLLTTGWVEQVKFAHEKKKQIERSSADAHTLLIIVSLSTCVESSLRRQYTFRNCQFTCLSITMESIISKLITTIISYLIGRFLWYNAKYAFWIIILIACCSGLALLHLCGYQPYAFTIRRSYATFQFDAVCFADRQMYTSIGADRCNPDFLCKTLIHDYALTEKLTLKVKKSDLLP